MSKRNKGGASAATNAAAAAPVPIAPPGATSAVEVAKIWLQAYRVELGLFLVSFFILACFSSQRFLRQSGAPQFVYQAKAWLEGRPDLDPALLPNIEDWACVRNPEAPQPDNLSVPPGAHLPCPVLPGAPGQSTDPRWFPPTARWYSSFPWFPAVVMIPFVAVNGYQFNDTSFGCFIGALTVALFYSLLRMLSREKELERSEVEDAILAAVLGFGTLFFYCAIRGEVWFSAEVMGVGLTCLYLRNAIGARHPVLAGLFFSMATLTRTPLMFAGLFFVLEAVCPGPTGRLEQLKKLAQDWKPAARKLAYFAAGAAPLALIAAGYNQYRFGKASEFGHSFLYFNRVNTDIQQYGLFHPHYLERNIKAAFLNMPDIHFDPFRLNYDPHGLSLLLTLPLLVFLLFPKTRPRLHWPLWLTVAVTAIPGLFYQNDGYMQFGFRFSLDYTPYVLLLFAIGGWSLKNRLVSAAMVLGFAVNFWGALAFRGYTELFHNW
jgi:hypothetical protein